MRWITGLLVAAAALGSAAAVQAGGRLDAQAAGAFIEELGARSLAVAESAASSAELQARLRPLLESGFDLELIGRFVLGRFSNDLSADEMAEFRRLYPDYLLRSYGGQLDRARGARLSVSEVKPVGKADQLVTTRLESASFDSFEAKWRVRRIDGAPKVIDVFFEGVSLALTQRDEFVSVIRQDGMDGLLSALRARTRSASVSPSTGNEERHLTPAVRFLMHYDGALGQLPAQL